MITGLYAITDPALMPGDLLVKKVAAALQGGCRLVQYRNKIGDYSQCLADAKQLRDLCGEYQARLIINDDLDLAMAVNADGVHLGQEDLDIATAKSRVDEHFILGATCHASLELALQAQKNGASYLAFGRFFPSRTKAIAPPANPEVIIQTKQRSNLPVVAIGGVTVDNAPALINRGADCVAVCYDLFQHHGLAEIRHKTEQFTACFEH